MERNFEATIPIEEECLPFPPSPLCTPAPLIEEENMLVKPLHLNQTFTRQKPKWNFRVVPMAILTVSICQVIFQQLEEFCTFLVF